MCTSDAHIELIVLALDVICYRRNQGTHSRLPIIYQRKNLKKNYIIFFFVNFKTKLTTKYVEEGKYYKQFGGSNTQRSIFNIMRLISW